MFATTTDQIEGHQIKQYLGLVSGETIAGINAIKDLGAGLRNVFGGRSAGYEEELLQARDSATQEMMQRAQQMGANAIVAVRYSYSAMGTGNMLLVSVTGTAVVAE